MFESDFANVLYTMLILTLLWVINRLLKSLAHSYEGRGHPHALLHLEGDPEGRGHHWTVGGILLPTHCSICQVRQQFHFLIKVDYLTFTY